MIKNMDIYTARTASACCLFLIFAEANLWLNPINNTFLVLGYRLFILFTPLMFYFMKHQLTLLAFYFAIFGLVFWWFDQAFLGTIFYAVGIAISGYMLKYYSAFTTQGAAANKMAISLGSVLSGIFLIFTQNLSLILTISFLMLIASLITFYQYYRRKNIVAFPIHQNHFHLRSIASKKGIAWALIGFVIGVKLIAIVSILPQYVMLTHNQHLPSWYGTMLMLNSVIIIFFQIPLINWIRVREKGDKIIATMPLTIAMIIIALSSVLGISSLLGALIWTVILAFLECTISYLDKISQEEDMLLIKEAAVGIGCAATVFLTRTTDPFYASLSIGVLSCIFIMVALILFKQEVIVGEEGDEENRSHRWKFEKRLMEP